MEFTTEEYLRELIEAISIAEQPLPLHAVLFHLLFQKAFPKNKKIIICGQGACALFGLGLQNLIFKMRNNWAYKFLHHKLIIKLLWAAQRITGHKELKRTLQKLQKMKDNLIWVLDEYGEKDWVCDYFKVTEDDIIKGRLNIIDSYMGRPIYDIISILDFFSHVCEMQSILSKLGEKQGKIILFPYTKAT